MVFGVLVVAPVSVVLILMPTWANLFSSRGFMPHLHCYLGNDRVVWLHVSSDALIGLSYLAISGMLAYLVYKARKDIPFQWMFLAFGLFIITCGFTHFMEVWTMWRPTYWLSGNIKLITAVASVATAAAFPLILPKIFLLIETAKASETRRVKLEAAHRELEEVYKRVRDLDQLKTDFFANVSHELRTPLTIILGLSDRQLEKQEHSPETRRDFEIIRRNGALLLRHVNELLDLSKIDAGRMMIRYSEVDVASLARLVGSYFPSLASSKGLHFTIKTPDRLDAQIDKEKVERILFNLLSNAFKFVPPGGTIHLEVAQREGKVLLSVQDNGPGIPPDKREVIFERFRQLEGGKNREAGGTGLGLAIAREFVLLHHGTIKIMEAPGGGALFEIELPIHAPEGAEVQKGIELQQSIESVAAQAVAELQSGSAPVENLNRVLSGAKVLVAEDNNEMAQFIMDILHEECNVARAKDGNEALAKLSVTKFDVVVTDIMMPGMSGDQLIRSMRSNPATENTPVIVLSARADDPLRVELLRAGARDYLVKPFHPEELKARVRNQYELIRSQKNMEELNQQLEQFNYSVSHDLRAPARAVKGYSTFLLQEKTEALDETVRNYLNRIVLAAERMETLIGDLLAFSQIRRGELPLKPVMLGEVLEACGTQMEATFREKQASISIENPLPAVMANRTALEQVICNLIGNALKYVASGTAPKVRIFAEPMGDYVRLHIEDNGIGIAKRHHDKIFQPFQRLHSSNEYPGSGVGLAIVAKAIERMNGRIGLMSEEGKGSVFWFELPNVK
ncbi:MAG: ATP-binding protein [Verrucomicrobiota bacterium]|nr:ATP-binding protein [Verrucomicrobiota bacterium]